MVFAEAAPANSKTDINRHRIREVKVGGGAWVIQGNRRVPKVVITEVTDDELAFLLKNDSFRRMHARGFMSIHTVGVMEADSRDLPADHEKKDNTSQILDSDHAHGLDPRCDHASTRAAYGEGNQFGGEQPDSVKETQYGEIRG